MAHLEDKQIRDESIVKCKVIARVPSNAPVHLHDYWQAKEGVGTRYIEMSAQLQESHRQVDLYIYNYTIR